jgi:hypothetical protein
MQIAYDRYMLPLLPLMILGVLGQVSRKRAHAPLAAWVSLLLFAGFGIALTHDYRARLRARVRGANELISAGISRNQISATVEYDGWTQLEATESIRGTEYTDFLEIDSSRGFRRGFWNHTTALTPEYVVLNWNRPDLPPGGRPPVRYRAWLPPFERSVAVFDRADLTAELEAARVAAVTPVRY